VRGGRGYHVLMKTNTSRKELSRVSGRVRVRLPQRAAEYDRVYRGIPLVGAGWALSSATPCETAQREACRAVERARPRTALIGAR